jgi:hypothetical protein
LASPEEDSEDFQQEFQNPKSEYQNPKQIQIFKIQMTQTLKNSLELVSF